jgi:hypothetical protein
MVYCKIDGMDEEVINYMDDPLEGQQIWYVPMESYHSFAPSPLPPTRSKINPLEEDTIAVF